MCMPGPAVRASPDFSRCSIVCVFVCTEQILSSFLTAALFKKHRFFLVL